MAKATPVQGKQLTSWSVLSGGTQIAIDMITQESGTRRIILPIDTLSALMTTLPRMLQSALDQRFPDRSLRVVQPLGDWRLEQQECSYGLILKLKTQDGFEVAFLLDKPLAGSLGNALLDVPRHLRADHIN